ncbi:MAG TPA: DUF4179 domain-containing protein, partial [Nitrolancea sp.]|nr:DUF4179 domain-containing protein [Nitrolancea sp.]
MLSDEELRREYSDLLADSSSVSLVAIVHDLDTLASPFRRAQPPAELMASIDELARERAATTHHGRIVRHFWLPSRFARPPAPSPTPPSRDRGGDDHGGRPNSSPYRWRRDLLGIVSTAIVLIIIGLGLAAVFRGQRQTPESPGAGGTSLPLDGFGANASAKLAYQRGLGTRTNLTQQLDGVTVSVQWVYADVNQLLAYVTIQGRNADIGEFAGDGPDEVQYERCPITFGLDDGAGTLTQPFDSAGFHDST